ncbi:MAG: hypothetical protein J0H74_09780 [Chitinophagaceae bacterium]|nr:hypothetical protein [Chitinophagaceae bacterium]
MKKHFLFMFYFLLSSTIAFAQSKPKTHVMNNVQALQKLLTGTGLPFRMANDTLAAIPYGGKNISSYQVVVQKISDLYIIYTNLTETLPGKIDETKYKYLLQQNDHYDAVKIGMSADDNIVYLRADVYKTAITTALLKRIIEQVANVANIIGGDLK